MDWFERGGDSQIIVYTRNEVIFMPIWHLPTSGSKVNTSVDLQTVKKMVIGGYYYGKICVDIIGPYKCLGKINLINILLNPLFK